MSRFASLLLTVGLLAGAANLAAQEPPAAPDATAAAARSAVYFELLGNGLVYSLNYDHRVRDNLTARGGLMYVGVEASTTEGGSAEVDLLLIPLMINRLFGDGSGRFELGIGPLLGGASGRAEDIEGVGDVEASGFGFAGVTSTIGYRYHPVDGGLVFRIGLTPFWSGSPQLWGGLSLGYAF